MGITKTSDYLNLLSENHPISFTSVLILKPFTIT
jgi:hypothetical protein